MEYVFVCCVMILQFGIEFKWLFENSFVDKLVWDKLEWFGIVLSELVDEGMFFCRVYFDIIGILLIVEQLWVYFKDIVMNKCKFLVDVLFEKEEYVVYWVMCWVDIFKVDLVKIGAQKVVVISCWLC